MEQYIPKAAVIAEMKNRIDKCNTKKKACPANTQVEAICDNKICAYREIISFLDTLETKEVNLEKEIERCLKQYSMLAVGKKDFTSIAKHFFGLGLKAQKGEKA